MQRKGIRIPLRRKGHKMLRHAVVAAGVGVLLLGVLFGNPHPASGAESVVPEWEVDALADGLRFRFPSPEQNRPSPTLRVVWLANQASPIAASDATVIADTAILTSEQWRANPKPLRQSRVFPGVDVEVHGVQGLPEFDFIVDPGTDPSNIRYSFPGYGATRTLSSGSLLVERDGMRFLQRPPVAFQHIDGERVLVEAQFVVDPDGAVRFALGNYRTDLPLVIDPTMEFSTYMSLGDSGEFRPVGVERSPSGDIFILGTGPETAVPALGPAYKPLPDAATGTILLRIDGETHQLISRTFLPWGKPQPYSGRERRLLAVDEAGHPWIAIPVSDTSLPVTGTPIGVFPPGLASNSARVLLLKLTLDASSIAYSTHIGCTGSLVPRAMAAGPQNSLVFLGVSPCRDFPTTPGAYRTAPAGFNRSSGGLLKINTSSHALEYSTYFSGSQGLAPLMEDYKLAVDSVGNAVLAFGTTIDDLPVTEGALQTKFPGGSAVYVASLSADGAELLAGTYLGGGQDDQFYDLALDHNDQIYLSGDTSNVGFPTTEGAYQVAPTLPRKIFVTKLRSDATALEFSSLVSGSNYSSSGVAYIEPLQDGSVLFLTRNPSVTLPVSQGAFSPVAAHQSTEHYLGRLSGDGSYLRYATALPSATAFEVMSTQSSGEGKLLLVGSTFRYGVIPTLGGWIANVEESMPEAATGSFLMTLDMGSPVSCGYTGQISPNPIGGGRETGTLSVNTQPGCPWVVRGQSDILAMQSKSGGVGPKDVSFEITANLQRSSRTVELQVGTATVSLIQKEGTCDYLEVQPESLIYPSERTSLRLRVLTPNGCPWDIGPSTAWFVEALSPGYPFGTSPQSGGQFTFALVSENSFEERSGFLTLGGKTVPVTQAGGGCTATISPTALTFDAQGGEQEIVLQTTGSNCAWNALTGVGVQLPEGSVGKGSSTIQVRMDANPDNQTRESFVYLANKSISITQSAGACVARFPSNIYEVERNGGYVWIPFEAEGDACRWHVTTDQPWVQFQGGGHQGSGQVAVFIETNASSEPREVTIYNLGQSMVIRQLGAGRSILELLGQKGYPIRVNGVLHTMPYRASWPDGSVVRLEPASHHRIAPLQLAVPTLWSDGQPASRTITVDSGLIGYTLNFDYLHRLPVENAPYGSLNLHVQGEESATFTEFYKLAPGLSELRFSATPEPLSNARFVGWVNDAGDGYDTRTTRTHDDGLSRYLRPRFERSGPLPDLHFMPENLFLVAYSDSPDTIHMAELRLNNPAQTVTLAGYQCDRGVAPFEVLSFDRKDYGYQLRLRLQNALLQPVGRRRVECIFSASVDGTGISRDWRVYLDVEGARTDDDGIKGVAHAATFSTRPLAPGGLYSAFGRNLATAPLVAPGIPLPQLLGEAQIRIYSEVDNVERIADLLYVSPTQINFHVPEDVPIGAAVVRSYRNGVLISDVEMPVERAEPGLFWVSIRGGSPAPAAHLILVAGGEQHLRWLYDCPDGICHLIPADIGGPDDDAYLNLYGTGLRGLSVQDIHLTINDVPLPVTYMDAHNYYVGLDQVNVRIPRSLAGSGLVSLRLEADGHTASYSLHIK